MIGDGMVEIEFIVPHPTLRLGAWSIAIAETESAKRAMGERGSTLES
jgi:hypothetical protein